MGYKVIHKEKYIASRRFLIVSVYEFSKCSFCDYLLTELLFDLLKSQKLKKNSRLRNDAINLFKSKKRGIYYNKIDVFQACKKCV